MELTRLTENDPVLTWLGVLKAMRSGDAKYGIETRFMGPPERHLLGALRHLTRMMAGEQRDHESFLPPVYHVIARLMQYEEARLRAIDQARDEDFICPQCNYAMKKHRGYPGKPGGLIYCPTEGRN